MPKFSCLLIVIAYSAAGSLEAQNQIRIEQARAVTLPTKLSTTPPVSTSSNLPSGDQAITQDDAFGAQRILKNTPPPRPFQAFAEMSAFATNNVALVNRSREADSFLVATFGLSYRHALTSTVQFETTLRGAMFRYNKFDVLSFNSVDAGGGVVWNPAQLPGVDLFLRYNFTDLFSEDGDTFFKNHTVTLGGQKTLALSRAHAVFAGASAQLGIADPAISQRDEYIAYTGYHLQATRQLDVDLLYRYGYFVYREEGDRRDHNQAISLGLRFRINDYAALSASSFVGINSSNQEVFDYDVLNGGGGVGVSLRF